MRKESENNKGGPSQSYVNFQTGVKCNYQFGGFSIFLASYPSVG